MLPVHVEAPVGINFAITVIQIVISPALAIALAELAAANVFAVRNVGVVRTFNGSWSQGHEMTT